MRQLVLESLQPHELDVMARLPLSLRPGSVLHLQAERDVLRHAHPGEQRIVLKDHGVLPAGLADRRAVDGDNALRRLFEPGRDVEQRCLAATAVAEDGAKSIVGDFEADIVERDHRADGTRLPVDLGHGGDCDLAHGKLLGHRQRPRQRAPGECADAGIDGKADNSDGQHADGDDVGAQHAARVVDQKT